MWSSEVMNPPVRIPSKKIVEEAAAIHGERTGLVKELLVALETATPAGQPYLMSKVVDLLRRESVRAIPRNHDRGAIATTIDGLSREAERRAPDTAAFTRRTVRLLAALGRV